MSEETKYIPGDSYRDAVKLPGPSLYQRIKAWISDHTLLLVIPSIFIGFITLIFVGAYFAAKAQDNAIAAHDRPYIDSKDIAIMDVVRSHGGGVKFWKTSDVSYPGGSGCLGMNIQVDVSHQTPGGRYTESSYCCDGKECRYLGSKEF